ncbi:hypothetical protein GN958_ATG15717 [Phytophthora infestans]|nr:hypothetical protein GN958_ATG15717 [Phytophthora infestans]
MASAEAGEQQHEAGGLNAAIQDALASGDAPVAADESELRSTKTTDQPGEPNSNDNELTNGHPGDAADVQSTSNAFPLLEAPTLTEKSLPEKRPSSDRMESTQLKSTDPGEVYPAEAENNEQSVSLGNAADEEEVDDVDLAPQLSSESLPAETASFLASLTADFAPDTKVMWAQIFGPRYDDGDAEEGFQEDNQSNADSSRESVSSKSSLQAKLARERKLDEQIQASQRRYRERMLRKEAANHAATRRGRVKSCRRPQAQIPTVSPFEQAGLSLTQIRFCTEKALDQTCKRFRHLHAAALEEAEDPDQPLIRGTYITHGELEHLLRELFDPHEFEHTHTRTRKGTIVAPLAFSQNDGVPMKIQLQASWFIPFGQLQQLRSLVMKITKRHLNEEKLAIVSRHLQKQLTLLPLSAKLQGLVLELSDFQLKEPEQAPKMWPEGKISLDELIQDLLGCIAVKEAAVVGDHLATMELSSVVSAQRLAFFRYLIDIVAAERTRLHSKTAEPSGPPVQTPLRRKTSTDRRRSTLKKKVAEHAPESVATSSNCEQPADDEETASIRSAHASLPSASEVDGANDGPAEDARFEPPEQIGDESEKPASQLQRQLELAIAQLRQTLPTVDSDVAQLDPAIRATYLAAVACQESVLLMLESNIDVDAAMSSKLTDFIEALQDIKIRANEQTGANASFPQLEIENLDSDLRDPPRFPPPYSESTASEEEEEEDNATDGSTVQTQFPPPYAITSPSYWTFTPSIPEPKSSVAKLVTTTSPNIKASAKFMANDAPGVGAYNIQKGEKLTFQRKPSFSFGPTEGGRDRKTPSASLPKGGVGKHNSKATLHPRMKTSREFQPPMRHSADDTDLDVDTTRTRGSQYNVSRLGTRGSADLLNDLPPEYSQGDANEAAEERTGEGDETEMDRALRLQQRMFMTEFVQQVVTNQESPTHYNDHNCGKTNHSRSAPYWATSDVSPGIERLLHRQRRAPSATKLRPSSASTAPAQSRATRRVGKETSAPPPPPRRQLDNDQHLAWAARISELYQPAVPTPDQ